MPCLAPLAPASRHLDFQVFSYLAKPPADDMHPLPSRLQKWMLLLRSRVLIMLW